MAFQVILIIHVLLSLGLVALVLIQQGKGADAGAAFGSGSAGSVFGPRGASSFIYKLTAGVAIGFFLTSLSLAYLATNELNINDKPQSVMEADSTANEPTSNILDIPTISGEILDISN